MSNILAIDPGKLSGWAYLSGDGSFFQSGELDFAGIAALVEEYGRKPSVQLVVERFVIGTTTGKRPDSNWSLEIIGLARWASILSGNPLVIQAPGNAKKFGLDGRLKVMGWWYKGGAGHANDAARHLLLYRVSTGWWDDRLLLD